MKLLPLYIWLTFFLFEQVCGRNKECDITCILVHAYAESYRLSRIVHKSRTSENRTMESSCDSDMSEETRDLVRRGLASDRKRRSGRADLCTDNQRLAPNRDMNTLYVRLPPAHVVQAEEPSARGLNLTVLENVRGQNYNNISIFAYSKPYRQRTS